MFMLISCSNLLCNIATSTCKLVLSSILSLAEAGNPSSELTIGMVFGGQGQKRMQVPYAPATFDCEYRVCTIELLHHRMWCCKAAGRHA